VHVAYRRLGRLVPRDAHQQEAAGEPIEESDARPGDLVFLGPPGRANHVAFWLGNGRILHATRRDDVSGVVEEDLDRARAGDPVRFARP
jgi:cell wall-associated NlpC family hydrolase